MPLYDDHFSGHMESGDWRTPVTGAGGCIWPTVPPARWYLASTNATGLLFFLNITGLLCLPSTEIAPNHDQFDWFGVGGPIAVTLCRKTYKPERPGYDFDVQLSVGSPCGGTLDFHVERGVEKCNRDILLGNQCCPSQPTWCTGSTFTAYQVEFDHTTPPT